MKKKQYIAPELQAIEYNVKASLLTGSITINVYSGDADEEEETL